MSGPNLRDTIDQAVKDQPGWVRILVAVLLLLAGAVGQRCAHTDPPTIEPTPVNVHVQPTPPPAVNLVLTPGHDRGRDRGPRPAHRSATVLR